jgi:hypothetical protein
MGWYNTKLYKTINLGKLGHSLSKFHQASFGFIFVHVCQLKLGSFISFINTNSRGVNKEIVSIANIGIHRKTQDLWWSVHQVQPFQRSTAKLPPSWSSRVQDGSWHSYHVTGDPVASRGCNEAFQWLAQCAWGSETCCEYSVRYSHIVIYRYTYYIYICIWYMICVYIICNQNQ